MLSIFQYGFILRGLEAGLLVAIIAPLIGIFLVLRRYSLIADTLSHVSFAGVALGVLLGINPVWTAIGVAVVSSLGIERLRTSKRIFGESALSLFLSGSLAIAIVLISYHRGISVNLSSYLFGSIVTVRQTDVWAVLIAGSIVALTVFALYKELVFISFDEEAAQVSGIPTKVINSILIVLAALTVALAIPIVGILLVSALIVIPVLTALQYHQSFKWTLLLAEIFSVLAVVLGILVSYYLNLATGGVIVLFSLLLFILSLLVNKQN